ncbi:MAG: ATP-dependent Clp protease proteolytic subunit, partial [Acholeplasmataceae bacterium]|nr:ATP-dependent Clp protease proteolytic subunit [Acholeplasmataceae bacterium]
VILSEKTGKPLSQIKLDTERDKYMFAEEAKEYGIVDEVMVKQK